MRVLVTGGRTFLDIKWLWGGLDLLHDTLPGGITEIIEGGASGADIRAQWWGERNNVPVTEVRADWEKHGAGLKMGQKNPAGMIRNNEMLKLDPDIVLATPGGRGTAHMVDIAKRRGLRVIQLEKMPLVRTPASEPLTVSRLGL